MLVIKAVIARWLVLNPLGWIRDFLKFALDQLGVMGQGCN